MKKIFLSLFILTNLVFISEAQKKTVSKTILKTIVTAPTPKSEGINLGVVIEKFIDNIEIDPDGIATEVLEVQRKHNSVYATNRFQKEAMEYNTDLTEIEVLEAYKITALGKKIIVPPNKIQLKPTPQTTAAPAFSSIKSLEIDYDGLKIGDTTYTKIRLREKKKYFAGKFTKLLYFAVLFEYKNVEINLSAPVGYPLVFDSVDVDGGKLPDENGRSRWQWKKTNTTVREFSADVDNYFDISPRLAISSFNDLDELGKMYWHEAKEKSAVTPEIQKLADEITKGITEPKAQAFAIYEWVNKNIRYLSIVLERGGWVPHSANSIIENGYGDCKDYTTLLQALLTAKGIESKHLLIRLDSSRWFPKVPSPEIFNHVILYIPSLDLFADATAPNTRLGLISGYMRGKNALLIGEKNEKFIVPEDKPEDNQFLSDTTVEFTADGSVKSLSANTYVGQPEMLFRPLFADAKFLTKSDYFVTTLLSYYGIKGTGKINSISDSHKVGEPFNVELTVNIDNFTSFLTKGNFSLPVMLNLQNLLELESLVKAEKIETPMFVGAITFCEKFQIKLPPGVVIETLPPNVKIENKTASFLTEYKLENGLVIYKRSLIVQKLTIEPDEYKEFKELIKKIPEEYTAKFSYTADATFAGGKKLEKKNISTTKKIDSDKVLTVVEVTKLEAELANNPSDHQLRQRLLEYYNYTKLTPAKLKNRIQHQLWFIANCPETELDEIFGWIFAYATPDDAEYKTLKAEWLKTLEKHKDNYQIRLNAAEFINETEPQLAENILLEGDKLFPDKYDFALKLFENYRTKLKGNKDLAEKKTVLTKAFEAGQKALLTLKKERSETRDSLRADLLPKLAEVAFELDKNEKASSLARELILEFGDDATELEFSEATHKGNILLGRIALKENNLVKAKEYLIIAVNSALRGKYYSFYPDMVLVKEFLVQGEKDIVLEYLKISEGFKGTDRLLLKKWQTEIKAGKTPKFEWY